MKSTSIWFVRIHTLIHSTLIFGWSHVFLKLSAWNQHYPNPFLSAFMLFYIVLYIHFWKGVDRCRQYIFQAFHLYIYIHTYIHTYIQSIILMYMYIYTHVNMYIRLYLYIYVCICIYDYIHISEVSPMYWFHSHVPWL